MEHEQERVASLIEELKYLGCEDKLDTLCIMFIGIEKRIKELEKNAEETGNMIANIIMTED